MIVQCMQARDYLKASDVYVKIAIGNAAWPIGVTMVCAGGNHRKFLLVNARGNASVPFTPTCSFGNHPSLAFVLPLRANDVRWASTSGQRARRSLPSSRRT